jgi:hypothetical protein
MNPAAQPVQQEDALKYLISALRKDRPHNTGYADYGYDLYLPNVIREYVSTEEHIREDAGDGRNDRRMREISPNFFAAAWELSRRGIIRPGVRILGAQSTQDGGAGAGYSVTPFGRQWLAEADDTFVPTEPERFGQLIAPFKGRLGPGFHQRAQQAIRCYGAHAYLACCVMCGAAAESILLSLAIAKTGDEGEILQRYRAANGRSKIENLVVGKARRPIQTAFLGFTDVLKYWRDESAHGTSSTISDVEAYTSLAVLLRFAQYAQDQWSELTQRVDPASPSEFQ